MRAWLLPGVALAFAAGLFASGTSIGGWVDPGLAFAVGAAACLGGALLDAHRHGPDPLVGTGLIEDPPPSVGAVSGGVRHRAPAAVAATVAGVLLLGLGWGGIHERRVDRSLLARLAPARVAVRGSLRVDPSSSPFGWSAVAIVDRVAWSEGEVALRAPVRLSGNGQVPAARRGDRISVDGTVVRPDEAGFGAILLHKGIAVELRVGTFTREGPSPNPLVRLSQSARNLVGRSIERVLPPREAGLLLGLLLGDDSKLDAGLERDFRASGLSHMLVVSGENVAMVLAPVLGAAALLRFSRTVRFLAGFGTVAFFTVLTGAEPSVLRASVMASLALVGVLLGRPRQTSSILAAAVLALLVLDPWLAWSIGFQLSAAATAGMVAAASPLSARFGRVLPESLALAAAATMAAQIGVTPLLLAYFNDVPLVTLPANVLAFPLASPSLLIGAAAASVGLISVPIGRFVGAIAIVPMRGLETIADRLAKAPFGHLTSDGGPVVLLVGFLVVVGLLWWLRTGWRPPRAVVLAGVVGLPLFVWAGALASGPPAGLTVRFLDVGQGDGALVTSPAGAAILIDGGPDEDRVATQLAALGVKRLDMVIESHPHADHIGGLSTVLSRTPVSVLLRPGCPDDSAAGTALARAVREERVPVIEPHAGDAFRVGDLSVAVLSPDRCWEGSESDVDNDSIVVLVSLHEDSILFTGDAQTSVQEWLLDEGLPWIDVLKVPHHGAGTSLSDFFDAVHAPVAVASVGLDNPYGHPVPETIAALESAGSAVWRTDLDGTVTVTLTGRGPTVESDR